MHSWSGTGWATRITFIEPFANSAAVLLARPGTPKIETLNDLDSYIANFWRATATCPEEVAEWADSPVNEVDLHARHRWLVLSPYAAEFRRRMRTEPGYFDARVAGWWCWGLCCWIGSGWCQSPDEVERNDGARPAIAGSDGGGQGVTRNGKKGPPGGTGDRNIKLGGGHGQFGNGIHAAGEKRPALSGDNPGSAGHGVHSGYLVEGQTAPLSNKMPRMTGGRKGDEYYGGLPQLADAFSRGRGVNGNDAAGTCEQRRAWLIDWFQRLRDRLRTVRVCCGDWTRVCDSESVTTRLGITGIFFDPPYGAGADRDKDLYAVDSLTVAADVRAYCLERGSNPKMRICLAGYAGEGHEVLEQHGWDCVAWAAQGGYGNRSAKGKENAKKERLWFSPHCKGDGGLFA